jgi:hypothetical protein
MADHYGALKLDIQAVENGREEPCGDPALKVIADFLKAAINAQATTAWRSVAPALNKAGKDSPVNAAFTYDPVNTKFSDNPLPALYLFRSQGGNFDDDASDYRVARSTWIAWWIFRQTTDAKSAIRFPFANAVAKLIDASLDDGRHPAYVQEGDTDVHAPSYTADADSIKESFATSASEQEFSGADLDGAIGGDEMAPPRSPTLTISGADVLPGSTVTWSGINAVDQEIAVEVEITGAGTFDANYDFKQITSVTLGTQSGSNATAQLGTAARAGLGTDIYTAAGLHDITPGRPTVKVINIPSHNGDPSTPYDALEVVLDVEERLVPDLEQYDLLDDESGSDGVNAGAEMTFVRSDESVIDTAFYDD